MLVSTILVMLIMPQLSENSLYTDPVSKHAFLVDRQAVIDAFYLNFIGFVSLYSIVDDKAVAVRTLGSSTRLSHINDDSPDWMLSVKHVLDQGIITTQIAEQLSKFAYLIKSGAIAPEDVSAVSVRTWLDKLHLQIHKPSLPIYKGLSDFYNGKIELSQLAQYLYHLSTTAHFKPISTELFQLGKKYSHVINANYDPTPIHNPSQVLPASSQSQPDQSNEVDDFIARVTLANFLELVGELSPRALSIIVVSKPAFDKLSTVFKTADIAVMVTTLNSLLLISPQLFKVLFDITAATKLPMFTSRLLEKLGGVDLSLVQSGIDKIFETAMTATLIGIVESAMNMPTEIMLYILSKGFGKFPITCATKFSKVKLSVFRKYGHDHSRIYAELDIVFRKLAVAKYGSAEYIAQSTLVKDLNRLYTTFNGTAEVAKLHDYIVSIANEDKISDPYRLNLLCGVVVPFNPNPSSATVSSVTQICLKFTTQLTALQVYPMLYRSGYIGVGYKLIRPTILTEHSSGDITDSDLIKFADAFHDATLLFELKDSSSIQNLGDSADSLVGSLLYDLKKDLQALPQKLALLRHAMTNPGMNTEDRLKTIATAIVGAHTSLNDLKAMIAGFDSRLETFVFDNLFIAAASDEVGRGEIGPHKQLSFDEVGEILRYNQVHMPVIRSDMTVEEKYEVFRKESVKIKPQAISKLELNDDDYDDLTIGFDKFNRYKHGGNAVKFIKSWNVNLPNNTFANKSYLDDLKSRGITELTVIPAFHGTGSVAASMILRYGFTVISENGGSGTVATVGRMLGDGIYFSDALDKVAQYIGDDGFSRGIGTQGYIFEMDAYLGVRKDSAYDRETPYADWYSAGVPGYVDEFTTVSPEWCVIMPLRQLVVKKVHLVELVDGGYIDRVKTRQSARQQRRMEESETELNEQVEISNQSQHVQHTTNYTFMDGNIPIDWNHTVRIEEFEPALYGHPEIDCTMHGPMIIFPSDTSSSKMVVNTGEFMRDHAKMSDWIAHLHRKV